MTARDEYAEQAILGALILGDRSTAETVWSLTSPAEFYRPTHAELAGHLHGMHRDAVVVEPGTVLHRLRQAGALTRIPGTYLHTLVALVPTATQAGHYAEQVHDTHLRRQGAVIAERLGQGLENPSVDVAESLMSAMDACETLAKATGPRHVEIPPDLDEFLATERSTRWVLPGLLTRGDRLILTGGEGAGKSVVLSQIAVCAAAGISPFSGRRQPPVRTLLVDLENGPDRMATRLRPLRDLTVAHKRPIPPGMLRLHSVPAGIDVTDHREGPALAAMVREVNPDLLVIGPLYRLHRGSLDKEEHAREVTVALDDLRVGADCALIVEAHAGHGYQGGRDLRPRGSSLLMGWAAYGLGLRVAAAKDRDDEGAWARQPAWVLDRWRGDRDESQWPHRLRRGTGYEWPWVSLDHPEAVAS